MSAARRNRLTDGYEDTLPGGGTNPGQASQALKVTVRVFVHSDLPRTAGASGHMGTLCLGVVAIMEGIREHGSVAKAAGAIGMSSRVASERMRKLESELGFELYNRLPSNRGSCLTEKGVEFLEVYRTLCSECEDFANMRLAEMLGQRPAVRFGPGGTEGDKSPFVDKTREKTDGSGDCNG